MMISIFIGVADNKLLFFENESRIIAYTLNGEISFDLKTRSHSKFYQLAPNSFGILSDDADYYFCDSLGESKGYANTSYAIGMFKSDEAFFKQEQYIVEDRIYSKMGVVNRKGKSIIDFKYDYIGPLVNGYRYCIDSLKKRSFIDVNGNELELQNRCLPITDYRNERILLVNNYGLYDGLALNSKRVSWTDSLNNINYKECYYYYDTTGTERLVLSDTILQAGSFSEGLAPALTKDRKIGFINKKGNWVIMPKYELSVAGAYPMPYIVVPYFFNGFAYIKSFKGYIDKEGNEFFTGKRMQDRYDFSH